MYIIIYNRCSLIFRSLLKLTLASISNIFSNFHDMAQQHSSLLSIIFVKFTAIIFLLNAVLTQQVLFTPVQCSYILVTPLSPLGTLSTATYSRIPLSLLSYIQLVFVMEYTRYTSIPGWYDFPIALLHRHSASSLQRTSTV